MFVVIIRGRNCRRYIRHCIRSLSKQTVQDWNALVILDAPTDGVQDIMPAVLEEYDVKDKVRVVVKDKRVGLAANMWYGICEAPPSLCEDLDDDDVLCVLDADDWLDKKALRVVQQAYQKNPDALVTYGSYRKRSKGARTRVSRPYKSEDKVRSAKWHGSHFKTFKWKLAKHLDQSWFRHKGEWLQAASDLAVMMPLMEMAGMDRCVWIERLIYNWRDDTPYKTNRKEQIRCEKIVRAKPQEKRIPRL